MKVTQTLYCWLCLWNDRGLEVGDRPQKEDGLDPGGPKGRPGGRGQAAVGGVGRASWKRKEWEP